MLDSQGFDRWIREYDPAVARSDRDGCYPFAGYAKLLDRICTLVVSRGRPAVLDLGFGTATLTARLYQSGCEIWGQDFSEGMRRLAQEKMPGAHLYGGDFSEGLAAPLRQQSYDFIVATYALHHLTDAGKLQLIRSVRGLLKNDGALLIGDVAFASRADMDRCRAQAGEAWDAEEHYFVADELKQALPDIVFEPVSFCGGLLTLKR